jgi:hypothetical protein
VAAHRRAAAASGGNTADDREFRGEDRLRLAIGALNAGSPGNASLPLTRRIVFRVLVAGHVRPDPVIGRAGASLLVNQSHGALASVDIAIRSGRSLPNKALRGRGIQVVLIVVLHGHEDPDGPGTSDVSTCRR